MCLRTTFIISSKYRSDVQVESHFDIATKLVTIISQSDNEVSNM